MAIHPITGPVPLVPLQRGMDKTETNWFYDAFVGQRQVHVIKTRLGVYTYGSPLENGGEASFHVGLLPTLRPCAVRGSRYQEQKVMHEKEAQKALDLVMNPHLIVIRTGCQSMGYGYEYDGQYAFSFMQLAHNTLYRFFFSRKHRATPTDVISVMKQLASLLEYMHTKGWAHADIKQENIVILDGGQLALIDWGQATNLNGQGTLTTANQQIRLMPPELLQEGQMPANYGAGLDMWMLGIVCWQLLFKDPPLEQPFLQSRDAETLREIEMKMSEALKIFELVRQNKPVNPNNEELAESWRRQWTQVREQLGEDGLRILSQLLCANPKERLTGAQLKNELSTLQQSDKPSWTDLAESDYKKELQQLRLDREAVLRDLGIDPYEGVESQQNSSSTETGESSETGSMRVNNGLSTTTDASTSTGRSPSTAEQTGPGNAASPRSPIFNSGALSTPTRQVSALAGATSPVSAEASQLASVEGEKTNKPVSSSKPKSSSHVKKKTSKSGLHKTLDDGANRTSAAISGAVLVGCITFMAISWCLMPTLLGLGMFLVSALMGAAAAGLLTGLAVIGQRQKLA